MAAIITRSSLGGERSVGDPDGARLPGMGRTWCRATLSYVGEGGLGDRFPVDVDIEDGRAADLPGWETCGFGVHDHPSTVGDWTDDDAIARVHYAEAAALARHLTGADVALVSDHVRRSAEPVKGKREQAPVPLVHSDFAPNYADVIRFAYQDVHGRGVATLERNGVTSRDVEAASRILMLQLWRNVGPPRMDHPVAFCDRRTVTPAEARPFRYTGYVAGGRSFDAIAIVGTDAERHRWYAFPELRADEVVAFRTYDTALVDARETYFTPHSAFRDPAVPVGQPARASVELRVMCLFG
jgi:hypothetical protein